MLLELEELVLVLAGVEEDGEELVRLKLEELMLVLNEVKEDGE